MLNQYKDFSVGISTVKENQFMIEFSMKEAPRFLGIFIWNPGVAWLAASLSGSFDAWNNMVSFKTEYIASTLWWCHDIPFYITGPLQGEFTGLWWNPLAKGQ